ncbi:ABC transporter substrate-binding protein [Actinomadura atramentaria]|uniref:ABC transporter substrate-binding protein n=1 Tax=Actinomadura atramentaria TaxID=1990 RepID=UPI0003A451BC|nr:ABC transporter substrate-binding protein [Actinomadura atramentaria]
MIRPTPRTGAAAVALAAAGTLLLSACNGAGGDGGGSGELKLGVILPLSGPAADLGKKSREGIDLYAETANKAGGVDVGGKKAKVKVVYCDSEYQSAKAVTCGRKLASRDGAAAVLTATSVDTLPLMSFNQQKGQEFIINTSAATDKVVQSGNKFISRYWFATSAYMPGTGKLLAQANTRDKLGIDKIAVLGTDDEFGTGWANDFAKGAEAAGFPAVRKASFKAGTTDLYPQLTPLITGGANLLALPLTCDMAASTVKQARQLGYKGRFMFMLACDADDVAGKLGGPKKLAGSLFESGPWNSGGTAEAEFQKAFQAKFGRRGDPSASTMYSQASWLATAASVAGSTDPVKMRAAMPKALDESANTLGITGMQPNGEVTGTVHLRLVGDDGAYREITE